MQYYKTVEEKSAEWNITTRHVQYLCRTGKIEGAIKRAGSWFIPEDVETPVKNTKSNAKGFPFVGTKNKIFNSAIELFMVDGFNNVSLRDIANSVGIRQSTIYNHFKSKQEILNTIYDFYRHYYLKDRPSLRDMETVVQNEDFLGVIRAISYDFNEHRQKLSDITKIIFQRIAIDTRAREISKSLMLDEGIKYVEDIFNKAVKIGKLPPVDTHALAILINSLRFFTLFNWIINPQESNMIKIMADEHTLYEYCAKFLSDLKPPVKGQVEPPVNDQME